MNNYLNKIKLYENDNNNTTVYSAINNGKTVVMKFTDKADGLKEKALIDRLQPHHHIIQLVDCIEVDEKTVCLVFPYIQDKWEALVGNMVLIRRYMHQLFMTLAHMHARGVVHCDLKPDNILFDGQNITIIDFGHAHTLEDLGDAEVGTGSYAPLELHITRRSDYSPVIDVWSAAVILYELLVQKRLFSGNNNDERLDKIDNFIEFMEENQVFDFRDELAVTLEKGEIMGLVPLLDGMFQHNPRKRYTAENCLQTYWVKKFCADAESVSTDTADTNLQLKSKLDLKTKHDNGVMDHDHHSEVSSEENHSDESQPVSPATGYPCCSCFFF